MPNSLLQRTSAILMAFLMLVSSTGFSMDVHYCNDEIKSFSLFGTAKTCAEKIDSNYMPPENKVCLSDDDLTRLDRKECCHNERLSSEILDVQVSSQDKIVHENNVVKFIAAFVAVYIFKHELITSHKPIYRHIAPNTDRDIQVLYQTFLI